MMRKIMLLLFCVAALVSFSTACGDDSEESMTVEEFAEANTARVCEVYFLCCTADELSDIGVRFDTEEECRTLSAKQFKQGAMDPLEAGRFSYNADKAAACQRETEAVACGEMFTTELPSCEHVFEGKVAEGGECGGWDECLESNSTCEGVEATDAGVITKLGTCKTLPSIGDECDSENYCEDDAYCDYDPFDTTVLATCKERKAVGEECSLGECAADTYCSSEGKCAKYKSVGEACESPSECDSWVCESPDGNPEGEKECLDDDTFEEMCIGN